MIDWETVYKVVIPLLALSYAVRTALFLGLHPNDLLEWSTTIASAGVLSFFAVLAYWLLVEDQQRPVIYPPLVIAAVIGMLTSVLFTYVATRDWVCRRRKRRS